MPIDAASHGPPPRGSAGPARPGRAALLLAAAAITLGAAPGGAGAQSPKPEPARGAVALLPLDAGPRLEIYGQAVATEIARALTAGGVEVVVVGASMDVPVGARLIVDGTLAMERGLVSLSMRVRNPIDNTVLDTLSATAPGLAQIDKAAADLSARVLPVVRERLAALTASRPGAPRPGHPPLPPGRAAVRLLLVGIAPAAGAEPLRGALAGSVERWVRRARRDPRVVEARTLAGKLAPKAVASTNAERAVAFEILGYSVKSTPGAREVPLARARVRVQISDASAVIFDRVVATDTIVGDRRMPPDELAARVAEEVLAILRPHVQRAAWPWP
jgi:hypothetical protein